MRAPQQRSDGTHEVDSLKPGSRLYSFIYPGRNEELVQRLQKVRKRISAFFSLTLKAWRNNFRHGLCTPYKPRTSL